LASGLSDKSALLKHEIAYVMGQTKNPYCIPILTKVLDNQRENTMVRHEAAEALGAIGNQESLETLKKYLNDPAQEIRETCQIAIDRINFYNSQTEIPSSPFVSTDPAPPFPKSYSIQQLSKILMDPSFSLFERYRAMFALRDKNNEESVLIIAEGLSEPKSALFRHEAAYVLGQLQHPAAIKALSKVVENTIENPMVRHEATEALGSIASKDSLPLLKKYLVDAEDVVRESCQVALDIQEYFVTDQFQYADGLSK